MFIPENVSLNTINVFLGSNTVTDKNLHKIYFDNNVSYLITLKKLCLNVIIENWKERPLINQFPIDEDARYILDKIPTNLPFKLAIEEIHDELYWRRAFRTRWPGKMTPERPVNIDYDIPNQFKRRGRKENIIVKLNTWKAFYVERHLQELIENLKPEEYDPLEIKELIELVKDYVIRLKINQLQAPINNNHNRVPLNAILPALDQLKQLSICFKQTYVGDNFNWSVLQTTQKDIENLAVGLNFCDLNVLRILNTDITCDKVKLLAFSLLRNENLKILDFSHCKIAFNGTLAICRLLSELPSLDELNLMNNFLDVKSVEILAYTLCNSKVNLKHLDLSLNNFGSGGYEYLTVMICRNKSLKSLILSACGLNDVNAKLIVQSLKVNTTIEVMDLSNNKFNEEVGELFLQLFYWKNQTLRKIDLRMCKIPTEICLEIEQYLYERSNVLKYNIREEREFFESRDDILEELDSDKKIDKGFVNAKSLEIELENVFADCFEFELRCENFVDSASQNVDQEVDIIDNENSDNDLEDLMI